MTHPEMSIWRNNSAGSDPLCIQFSKPKQNHMLLTTVKTESKPEVEFQHDGRFHNRKYLNLSHGLRWKNYKYKFCKKLLFHNNV